MDAMKYECFVRGAFSIERDSLIKRGEDPLGIADADIFNLSYNHKEYLDKVKSGVVSSIELYNQKIFRDSNVNEEDRTKMINLINRANCAESSEELLEVIDEYKIFRDKYFTFR